MALRNVVVEGDEILRKKCREVSEITDRIKLTLEDMLETMREEMGVGIAAPQIGVMRRMFIAEPEPDRTYFMINPEILEMDGEQTGAEGCLSVPGKYGKVERPTEVTVRATDRDGNEYEITGEGLLARALCHEIDHLDGILYTDKVIRMLGADEVE